jgi:hypothetical protein
MLPARLRALVSGAYGSSYGCSVPLLRQDQDAPAKSLRVARVGARPEQGQGNGDRDLQDEPRRFQERLARTVKEAKFDHGQQADGACPEAGAQSGPDRDGSHNSRWRTRRSLGAQRGDDERSCDAEPQDKKAGAGRARWEKRGKTQHERMLWAAVARRTAPKWCKALALSSPSTPESCSSLRADSLDAHDLG